MERILVGNLKNTMYGFGRKFISSGIKEPKGRIQLKGNSEHLQSFWSQSNYIQSFPHMSKRFPLTVQITKNMSEFQKTALNCISPGMLSIWAFQRKSTLFHRPNSSMVYFHSQTTSPENDDDNNYDCNLISIDSGAQPSEKYEAMCEPKEDEIKCERKKHALQIQQQFRKIRDTANRRMFELQEEFGKMQRISFEFQYLTELSPYDEKFASLEERLIELREAILVSDTKFHKLKLGHQNLMRVANEINQRSKQQSEFNDETVAMNSRQLTRMQMKLNIINRELMKQSIVLHEWKSAPEKNYEQLKKDFDVMLDKRFKSVKADLNRQRSDIFFYHITLCGLVLLVITSDIITWFK